jgi:hypothetical protein
VQRGADGTLMSIPQRALSRDELRDAIFSTPYEKMPYAAYWERLEAAYRVGLAAEQSGARGAPRGNPFGAIDHAQLLPDGLLVLLGDQFLARGARRRRRRRAPRRRRMHDDDRAHHRGTSRKRAPSYFRTIFSLLPAIAASCRCAKPSSKRRNRDEFRRSCSSSAPTESMR